MWKGTPTFHWPVQASEEAEMGLCGRPRFPVGLDLLPPALQCCYLFSSVAALQGLS